MIDITVVIPTYKRHDLLKKCLMALSRQDFPLSQSEVIVADDEASLGTKSLIDSLKGSLFNLHYVPVQNAHGPAAARNQGWRQAQGEVIAFTDDDCLPDVTWLKEAWAVFEKLPQVDAAWGSISMPLANRPTLYESNAAQLSKTFFVTANCFCRKSILEQVKGFDERFKKAWREDSDLYCTLLKHDKCIVHIPQAIVQHPIRPAHFSVVFKQEKNNFYEALLFKKHPQYYKRWFSYACVPIYYLAVISFLTVLLALGTRQGFLGWTGAIVFLVIVLGLFLQKIAMTSKRPGHIFQAALVCCFIPFLSVGWRLAGALRFKVLFF